MELTAEQKSFISKLSGVKKVEKDAITIDSPERFREIQIKVINATALECDDEGELDSSYGFMLDDLAWQLDKAHLELTNEIAKIC